MRIAIGSDHAGFRYKEMFKARLAELGHEVKDFGTDSEQAVDYPLYCRPVAEAVASGDVERGIVIGGSGNGEAMVANRVRGVRAALCWNVESASMGRHHNDANVLSLGERMVPEDLAIQILETWLNTPFDGGRHQRRIEEIDAV
jgi:ribose 5-phosphate isomerase B